MNGSELQEKKLIDQKIDYFKILKIFWSRWYWIAGCMILAGGIGYLYLWYTPEVFTTSGSLKFEEKSDYSKILAGALKPTHNNTVQSETYVIKSRDVILNAVSRLDYKVSYFLRGRVRTTDAYPKKPFPIEIIHQDSINFFKDYFELTQIDRKKFLLSFKRGAKLVEKEYSFGDRIKLLGITFKVKESNAAPGASYMIKFNAREDFLSRINSGLFLKEAPNSTNILQLTYRDHNPVFAADILNALMQEYVAYDLKERGTSASQIIEFIEQQLKFLYDQVQETGGALEAYKRSNKIVNLSTSTQMSIARLTTQQTQRNSLKVEELAINQLEEQIRNNKDEIALNLNLEGSLGGLLANLVGQLNKYILEREGKLTQFNPNSQTIQIIDKQIAETKKAIITNIRLYRERNKRTQKYVESQIASAERELSNIPSAERDFAKLQSDFDINQKVFSLLSEKRLESQIMRAAVVPGAVIVNAAVGTSVVSPIPSKIYTNAILLGLVVGLGMVLLVRLLNPYIYDKETVESLTSTPIIGVIRQFPGYIDQDNRQALSLQKPKSVFAESVRSVRTNLSFLAGEKDSKVICITSEIAGEGKSFVSVNLASTLALIDKKVILIGADLRRSKLHRTFNIENNKGLSSFLSKQTPFEHIIYKTSLEKLDFVPSGPVPPNPSELLHSSNMIGLLERLKEEYDYILLDTAPVGLVSDSIPLIRNSDINLFVIRSGASKTSAAAIPDRLSMEYHLNNVVIVLNAFIDDALHSRYYKSNYSGAYGQYYYYSDYSGYSSSGYYTDDKKKSWWKFWKKS
ncbi:GumC family protein [Desertivirga xinjiangensis]|uniref:GumC family protein n=1 Tax=Desertivirga xinjiangensis TaxID=539206 RepID=UPI00210BFAF8|nr:tyrosine-protein kinase family protein [Pedobacter xinjiangensis]